MAWENSNRRQRLPRDWHIIRAAVLKDSGYECDIPGCPERATDVDHSVPGDDHSRSNLVPLCRGHHIRKSSHEGVSARARIRALRRRPEGRHPGRT